MGLENLKSIFNEGVGNPFTTPPIDNQTPVLDKYSPSEINSDVVLDEYPGITKYVSPLNDEYNGITFGNNFYEGSQFDDLLDMRIPQDDIKRYQDKTFDDRLNNTISDNILNINPYTGTAFDDEQTIGPTDVPYFAKDYVFNTIKPNPVLSDVNPPTTDMSSQIESIYNKTMTLSTTDFDYFNRDREFKTPPKNKEERPNISSVNPAPIIFKDQGDIGNKRNQFNLLYDGNEQNAKQLKQDLSGVGPITLRLERETFGFNEPYIISPMGGKDSGREFPVARSMKDIKRLSQYLFSPKGLAFFAKQNLLGANSVNYFPTYDWSGNRGIGKSKQRFRSLYLQSSTLAASTRLLGYGTPNILAERDFPVGEFLINDLFGDGTYSNHILFEPYTKANEETFNDPSGDSNGGFNFGNFLLE